MTAQQIAAAKALEKALNRCHNEGLRGGVYEGSFCLWPLSVQDPRESGSSGNYREDYDNRNFFSLVRRDGMILDGVFMGLDGGSGT